MKLKVVPEYGWFKGREFEDIAFRARTYNPIIVKDLKKLLSKSQDLRTSEELLLLPPAWFISLHEVFYLCLFSAKSK